MPACQNSRGSVTKEEEEEEVKQACLFMRNLHFFSCLWGCCNSSSTPYASEDEVTNLRRDLKIVEGTLKSSLNDLAVARNQAEAAEQNLKELVSLTTEHLLDPDKVWTDGEIVLHQMLKTTYPRILQAAVAQLKGHIFPVTKNTSLKLRRRSKKEEDVKSRSECQKIVFHDISLILPSDTAFQESAPLQVEQATQNMALTRFKVNATCYCDWLDILVYNKQASEPAVLRLRDVPSITALFAVEGGLAHSNMNLLFLQEPKVTIKFYDDEFASDMKERAVVESSLAKLLYTSISKERPFVVSPMANSSEGSKEGQKKYKKSK